MVLVTEEPRRGTVFYVAECLWCQTSCESPEEDPVRTWASAHDCMTEGGGRHLVLD